ncbi:HAD family hydrolase [archaeon]|jgi:HAD superfamily phosphatase (TIGR01681 family)|nr:HAD family hydrolase [archaeon]
MKKEIIFFDGDGTLWYPKKTKYSRHPVWLYLDKRFKNHTTHLTIIPSVISTLKKLKEKGIITILLSTHPHPPREAKTIIDHKIRYFKLEKFFDGIHATRPIKNSKGKFILKILKKRNIQKSKALMVGDSYEWDYKPAKDAGVDATLIESKYEKHQDKAEKRIKNIKEILKLI